MSDSEDNSGKTGRFPWLNDSNYAEWRMRMEAVLIRKGLYGMIEPDVVTEGKTEEEAEKAILAARLKRTKTKMAEARGLMIERAEKSQLAHMRDADPMTIWENLAKVHLARGLATRLALRRKLMSARKGTESMQAWIGKVKGFAWDLEEVGYKIDDEDLILALTMGLDETYETFVISLDSTPADELGLDYVINRLLNEEVRRGGKDKPEVVMAARTGGFAGPGVARTGCWRCGKDGHIRAFCQEKPPARREAESDESDGATAHAFFV